MATIFCEVTAGIRESERTVSVRDYSGRAQFLRVEQGFLRDINGRKCLPVGIVGRDDSKALALIELPHEADSGVNRLWVNEAELQEA